MNFKKIFAGILVLVFVFSSDLFAQKKKEKYAMFTTVEMKPVRGKEKALESAVKAHNAKFHTEDPHKALLQTILTGRKSGNYVWIMGPSMFSDMDKRPGDDAHEGDWNTTVDPNVKHYGATEYWKFNDKLSFTASNSENDKMSQIWFIDVEKGQWEKFEATMGKAKAASEKKGDDSFHVYYNQFSEDNGRDVALVLSFNTWSDLDIDDPFKTHYEAMHGKDSWKTFLEDWEASISSINQVVVKVVD